VARVGNRYLGTVPLEPTTMAGAEMQRTIGRASGLGWAEARRRVTIVGLTNGFLQYVATRAEYTVQSYEGGSTLFGPHESEAFATQLGALATALRQAGEQSPQNIIGPIVKYPGNPTRVLPKDTLPGSAPDPKAHWVSCRGDTLVGRWTGVYPIQLHLREGPILRIDRPDDGGSHVVALDDDTQLEVRSLGKAKHGWDYEIRWVPGAIPGPFSLQILDSAGAALGNPSDQCSPTRAATSGTTSLEQP
jgi:neutral ceramidase